MLLPNDQTRTFRSWASWDECGISAAQFEDLARQRPGSS